MKRLCYLFLSTLAVSAAGSHAQAENFERCDSTQIQVITKAVDEARFLIDGTVAAVGDTQTYRNWFGGYSEANAKIVKDNFGAMKSALLIGTITAVCAKNGEDDCKTGDFANVAPNDPYVLYLCEGFFTLPSVYDPVTPPLSDDFGTREGTIIHEVSHFDIVADTDDDLCYGRSQCSALAAGNAAQAISNADSYQYFAEDYKLGF